jgi:hypothetical protein
MFSCKFFHFFRIKNLDPVGVQPKMLDPDPESMNPAIHDYFVTSGPFLLKEKTENVYGI